MANYNSEYNSEYKYEYKYEYESDNKSYNLWDETDNDYITYKYQEINYHYLTFTRFLINLYKLERLFCASSY
jgi:hypothetical protein